MTYMVSYNLFWENSPLEEFLQGKGKSALEMLYDKMIGELRFRILLRWPFSRHTYAGGTFFRLPLIILCP